MTTRLPAAPSLEQLRKQAKELVRERRTGSEPLRLSDAQREKIARRSALSRMPEPVDVARSVEFLLGDGGRNITGTVITIDAGNTA